MGLVPSVSQQSACFWFRSRDRVHGGCGNRRIKTAFELAAAFGDTVSRPPEFEDVIQPLKKFTLMLTFRALGKLRKVTVKGYTRIK